MRRGRPAEIEDSRLVCFDAGIKHRTYIAAIIARLKRETGDEAVSRAEALRHIIEEHQRLTDTPDPSP